MWIHNAYTCKQHSTAHLHTLVDPLFTYIEIDTGHMHIKIHTHKETLKLFIEMTLETFLSVRPSARLYLLSVFVREL